MNVIAPRRSAVSAAVVLVASALTATSGFIAGAAAAEPNSFSALVGSWSGSGQFRLEDGTVQRMRCTASYSGGGSVLNLSIRCASPNNTIDMRGHLKASGGRVSGNWSESTFGLDGSASGQASANRMSLRLSGGLSGSMSVGFTRASQNITISTQSAALRSVSISMSRR